MSHESRYGFPAELGLYATGAPGLRAFTPPTLMLLFDVEFQAIWVFYSIPRRYPTAPHTIPKEMKP